MSLWPVNGAPELRLASLFADVAALTAAAAAADPRASLPAIHVTMGRTADNTVATYASVPGISPALENMVSRKHAVLRVDNGQLQLMDLGAVNKTYLNDVPLLPRVWTTLSDGDVVSLGGRQRIMVCGQPHLNPWTWRLRDVAVFLASYVPPVLDSALLAAGAVSGNDVARSGKEVFRFSPGRAADPMVAGTRPPAPAAPGPLQRAASQEVFSFRSNAPPVAACDGSRRSVGAAAVGSRAVAAVISLPQPRAATAGDVIGSMVSEDSGQLELAALEAYEAAAAVMGSGSAAEPARPSALPLVQQPQLDQPQQHAAPHECRRRQQLAPPAAADVIDLTLSEDDSSPPRHGFGALDAVQQRQQQQQAEPDPSGSPSKRRGDGSAQGSPAKRAKPSPDGVQVGPAAAQSARGGRGTVKLQQHLVCSICQDVVVAAHSMVPCGHQFCAECLSGWLATKRAGSADCPVCRAKAEAPPVRAITIDNIVADLLHELPADEQEAYHEKKSAWEARRDDIERGLKAPWAAGGRPNSSGARGRQRSGGGVRIIPAAAHVADPDPNGLLQAALAAFLGGPAPGYFSSSGTNRGYVAAAPAVHSYRVEYANRGAGPCTACSGAIDENMLRVGTRPQTHGRPAAWRWFHIHCMPPSGWQEARLRGVENMRNISLPDQAAVREHMRSQR